MIISWDPTNVRESSWIDHKACGAYDLAVKRVCLKHLPATFQKACYGMQTGRGETPAAVYA